MAQSVWDAALLDCKRTNAVSYNQFANSLAIVGAGDGISNGDSIIATSLERSDVAVNGVLNIGGLQTNNSRVLSTDITPPSVGAARQTYLFMKHLRTAKAFMDNIAVAE